MKWMGALCIAVAAVWGRWEQLAAARRQRETLAGMTAALRQMAEEVRVARTPMPQLLACLGRSCSGETGRFFHTAAEGLRDGGTLGELWKTALEEIELPGEALGVLRELAAGLQGDEEGVCRALSLAVSRLDQQAAAWDRRRQAVEQRGNALWFSASALLVILLI